MEWGDSSELQDIFRAEVADRAALLLAGAQSVIDGSFSADPEADLTRAAHTIKGSARVMGFEFAAQGAALMEEIWETLETGGLTPTAELGQLLATVARMTPIAVGSRAAGDISNLQAAVVALDRAVNGPDRGLSGAAGSPYGGDGVDDGPEVGDPLFSAPRNLVTSPESQVDLGGLLPSLHDRMADGSTRVAIPKLYQLINRTVEARLDASDLIANFQQTMEALESGDDADHILAEWRGSVEALDAALEGIELQAFELASMRFNELTNTFPQLVRFVARRTGKEVRFELVGDGLEVDLQILERLHEPLRHLLVNAIDHGIEPPDERQRAGKKPTGTVAMRASISDHRLRIVVEDDGRGIDWERVAEQGVARGSITEDKVTDQAELSRLLYLSGFSTVPRANDISGDGSGLAAVAQLAEEVNGSLELSSVAGVGTSVTITLPSSVALQDLFLVEAEGQQWGLPATAIAATLPIASANIVPGNDRMNLSHNGVSLPLASFATAVGLSESEPVNEILVVNARLGQFALTVPRVIGRRRVAVKGIGPLLGGVPHITGAAMLGAGRVVLIVEPNRIGDRVRSVPLPVSGRPRVLVVDDSPGVRQMIAAALSSTGFEVEVAGDADYALERLAGDTFDVLVVDYLMPGSDGVELVTTVRQHHNLLKIVMVSGVADEDDKDRAWSAGVDAYLDKFDLRQGALVATLRSLLGIEEVTYRSTGLAV